MYSHSAYENTSVFTFTDAEKISSVRADEDVELLEHTEHAGLSISDDGDLGENRMWSPPGPARSTIHRHSGVPALRASSSSSLSPQNVSSASSSSPLGRGGAADRISGSRPSFSTPPPPRPQPLGGDDGEDGGGEEDEVRHGWPFSSSSSSSSSAGLDDALATIPGLQLNEALPLPPFFLSGVDFPPIVMVPGEDDVRNGRQNGDEENNHMEAKFASHALVSASSSTSSSGASTHAAHTVSLIFSHLFGSTTAPRPSPLPEGEEAVGTTASSSSSIVLPCVSVHCRMMVTASKGSAALRELFQLQAIERKNKDVMDTSISNLTALMQKAVRPPPPTTTNHKSASGRRSEEDTAHPNPPHGATPPPPSLLGPPPVLPSTSSPPLPPMKGTQEAEMEKETRWEEMQRVRKTLPIYQCRRALLRMIGENPVTIVVGETGSGKTTQLVQYLYEAGYAKEVVGEEEKDEHEEDEEEEAKMEDAGEKGTHSPPKTTQKKRLRPGRIACTQPRRLAAVGVARRVSEEVGCPLGSIVGYTIHLDDVTSDATRVQFLTDGVLLRHLTQDPDLNAFRVILLDEAHERSMDTDVLMGAIKAAVARRGGELKLLVASATLDAEKFSRFFHDAPCFYIPGRMYAVKEVYTPDPVEDYVAEAVFRVCQLHLQMPLTGVVPDDAQELQGEASTREGREKHDILVFMSGKDDVMGTCELIHRRLAAMNPAARRTLLLLPCLSEGGASLSVRALAAPPPQIDAAAKQTKNDDDHAWQPEKEETHVAPDSALDGISVGVLDPTPAGFRKCVVATNVAETSLTIDGVRYVIDAGYMKTNVYRPSLGMNTLQRYPISRAQGNQRKGRAGRTAEGICFRLYTERQWEEEMLAQGVPELQRSSMDGVVLLLKSVLGSRHAPPKRKTKREEIDAPTEADKTAFPSGSLSRWGAGRGAPHRGGQQPPLALGKEGHSFRSSSSLSMDTRWERRPPRDRADPKNRPSSSLRQFDFIDPPPPITIQRSMWTLYLMGFLDPMGDITADGTHALEFPMSPMLAKLVLEGGRNDCLVEVCRIVAMLCADPKHLFDTPKGREDVAQRQHSQFKVVNSDHLTYLYVLTEFIAHGGGGGGSGGGGGGPVSYTSASTREWVRKHFLHLPTLQRAVDIYAQVMERATRVFPPSSSSASSLPPNKNKNGTMEAPTSECLAASNDRVQRWERTRRCLAHSFFLQSAQRSGDDWSVYRPLFHAGVRSQLHPASSIGTLAETPMYVVYHDLLSLTVTQQQPPSQTSSSSFASSIKKEAAEVASVHKEYLMVVTAVEAGWLVEASHGTLEWRDPVLRRRYSEKMQREREEVERGKAEQERQRTMSTSTRHTESNRMQEVPFPVCKERRVELKEERERAWEQKGSAGGRVWSDATREGAVPSRGTASLSPTAHPPPSSPPKRAVVPASRGNVWDASMKQRRNI